MLLITLALLVAGPMEATPRALQPAVTSAAVQQPASTLVLSTLALTCAAVNATAPSQDPSCDGLLGLVDSSATRTRRVVYRELYPVAFLTTFFALGAASALLVGTVTAVAFALAQLQQNGGTPPASG